MQAQLQNGPQVMPQHFPMNAPPQQQQQQPQHSAPSMNAGSGGAPGGPGGAYGNGNPFGALGAPSLGPGSLAPGAGAPGNGPFMNIGGNQQQQKPQQQPKQPSECANLIFIYPINLHLNNETMFDYWALFMEVTHLFTHSHTYTHTKTQQ